MKRGGIGRLPLGGALELRQRIVPPADLAQRQGQPGFDLRVVAAAGGGLERRDGGLGAALQQQGKTENVQCAGVSWIAF